MAQIVLKASKGYPQLDAYFEKQENYKNTATYQVTSWDEVIEHFIDEIEEI